MLNSIEKTPIIIAPNMKMLWVDILLACRILTANAPILIENERQLNKYEYYV